MFFSGYVPPRVTRPFLLITNDDGIQSEPMRMLADDLATDCEVLVVAPERQRSAASHAITLHKPLRLTEVGPARYMLSGTPVDCVYLGVLRLAKRVPDLVLSGVNDGYNLGSDIFYSGTVAGAVEGGLRGSVGVALSMAPRAHDPAAGVALCASIVRRALGAKLPVRTVLNVNTPGRADGQWQWRCSNGAMLDDATVRRLRDLTGASGRLATSSS